MATAAGAISSRMNTVSPRYRAAETTLWRKYGLEPEEHLVELPEFGTTIRVVEVGTGPATLFIPGTGGTGPYWAPLVSALADRRCLLVDRPGWGVSGAVDYRDADYGALVARILWSLLDRLDLEQADVVGASIGALWGLRLAQHRPARVQRLVLIGGFPNSEVPIPTFIKLLRSPLGALIVRLPMRANLLRKQLVGLGHGPALEHGDMDSFIDWRLAFHRETTSMHHERDMVRAMMGSDGFRPSVTFTRDELAGIGQPTLMVFGANDPTGDVETWRRFINAMSDAELRVVDGAGHMPWWDDAKAVGGLVAAHLEAPSS